MERIVITGALGQIGTELVLKCREIYGNDNVLATDIREPEEDSPVNNGPFEVLDVTNREAMMAIVENFKSRYVNAYGCIIIGLRKILY